MYGGSRRGRGRGGGRGRGNGMLLMLAMHVVSQFMQLERKPPVTAALIAANVLVYLRPGRLDDLLPSLHDVCLNPQLVLKDFDLKRVFMSAFYHVDETHLVYNMLSLLWKGVQLEVNVGSGKFAAMIAVLLGLSHGLVVLLSKVLSADSPELLYTDCAVGFSAVLFALKVVLNYNSPRHTNIYGVLVPSRYAAWAELILIQIFVPGTSFLGHLCGILAGLLYIHVPRFFAGGRIYSTSLMRVAQWPWLILRGPFRFLSFYSRGLRERAFGHGRVGSSRDQAPRRDIGSPWLADTVWRCPACTYDNGAFVDICDMCGTARSSSVGQESNSSDSTETVASAPPWPPSDPSSSISTPSLEQLRQARLARFSGR